MLDVSLFFISKVNIPLEIAFFTPKNVCPFCSLNIRYSLLKEKAGKGQKTPQGECISGWPTCFSEAFSQPDPKGATLTNLKWHHWCPQDLSLSPEILYTHTHTHSWSAVVHKDKSVVMLLALPSLWQNELCSLCQEDTQHHRAPDGYLRSQWMQNVWVNSPWTNRKPRAYSQFDILGLT